MNPPEPYDSPLRWLCRSTSRPDEVHLVDLGEGEDGECSCEDHLMRKKRCKHITATREHLLNLIIHHEKTTHPWPDASPV